MQRLDTTPYWMTHAPQAEYPRLESDIEVDTIVIGGGLTGLTAALLLKQAGQKVAVIEQHRVGGGDSGHTTAHLTEIVDTRYGTLISDFGLDGARMAARSSRMAIEHIGGWARALRIDCDFERLPAYLYTENRDHIQELRDELEALEQIGIASSWVSAAPLPFSNRGGIRVDNQAQFHPYKYMMGIAAAIHGGSCQIFEHTHANLIEEGSADGGRPCRVICDHGILRGKQIVIATNSITVNRVLLQTKLAAYRTYAMGVRLEGNLPPRGLYWDTAEPYHYIRMHDDVLIVGGEDHKTGMISDTGACFERLKEYSQKRFPVAAFPNAWSGQILEPVDGLPYIGLNPGSHHTYIAAGYSGNGMTFSTLAGILMSDLVLKRQNAWAELYNPGRIKPIASAREYLSENKDFPLCFLKDRLTTPNIDSLAEIPLGEGRTVRMDGKVLAVYRPEDGKPAQACSAVCTHLGCYVHWNGAEKTWDCPCHGSRFAVDGEVLNGPALKALERVEITRPQPESPRREPRKQPSRDREAGAQAQHVLRVVKNAT